MISLQDLLAHAFVERLGWGLLHFLWVGAIIAALLAIVLRGLRHRSPQARYLAGWMALLAMVASVPAIAAMVTPLPPVVKMVELEPVPIEPMPPAPIEIEDDRPLPAPEEALAPLPPVIAPPAVKLTLADRIVAALRPTLPWLVGGWLVGSLMIAVWHLGGWWQLGRLRRVGISEPQPEVQQVLANLFARFAMRGPVKLLISARVAVPTLIGWLRPVILVPASVLTELPVQHLELILAHELAHLRRCDFLLNLVQTAIETLLFYHPAVWWVSRQIRIERENCCDEQVANVSDRLSYARALTALAELCGQSRGAFAGLAMGADGGSLNARIRRLLGRPCENTFPAARSGGALRRRIPGAPRPPGNGSRASPRCPTRRRADKSDANRRGEEGRNAQGRPDHGDRFRIDDGRGRTNGRRLRPNRRRRDRPPRRELRHPTRGS